MALAEPMNFQPKFDSGKPVDGTLKVADGAPKPPRTTARRAA